MIAIIALALVGIAAMILELFVPAGGIIGLVGLGSIIAAIIRTFQTQGTLVGSIFLLASFIAVPTIFILYFKYFPRTFFGKRLILSGSQTREEGYSSHTEHPYESLKGKSGITETKLRPVGTVLIEGQRYNAVTDGDFIEQNTTIKVVYTEGNRIVVRKGES